MEINTHNADILLSAANKSHYPQDEIPEVALAGRSNVGKSSFINTLLNRKNLARTSGKPGKTQLLNFFNLKYYEIPVILVATKADKIPRGKWNKHESIIKKKLDFDPADTFIVFSSVTKEGLEESWDAILENAFYEIN